MNKLWLSASLVALVAILVAGVSWQASKNKNLSPDDVTLETCKSLVYNNPNAINLLFFSSKRDAEVYSNYLLNIKPFNSNKKKFNIYYIDDYIPECTHYRSIALFCDSRDLTLKSSSCPHDYVFVLKKDNPDIRSSSYNLINSVNTNTELSVIGHEFGHSFAGLAEEYAPADLPAGQPNCKLKCEDFGQYSSSCFSECSDSTHYRSIENGIMRTLSSDEYGEYNEQVVSSIITELSANTDTKTTGLVIDESSNCAEQSQLVIDAHYFQGNLVIDSLTKTSGCAPNKNIGPGTTSIIQNGKVVSSYNTPDFRNIFTDAHPTNNNEGNTIDGDVFQQEDSFSFSIPFSPGDTVENRDSNNQMSQLSMSKIGATLCRIE